MYRSCIDRVEQIKIEMTDHPIFDGKSSARTRPANIAVLKMGHQQSRRLTLRGLGCGCRRRRSAIGNPIGHIAQTVTAGIVSAKGRSSNQRRQLRGLLQADGPINQGNSGSANQRSRRADRHRFTISLDFRAASIGIGFGIPLSAATP